MTVTDSAKKTERYTDKDKDGIIYVKSMTPGKCTISMKASGGYSVPADITADVKANIEYKAVDVCAEIKSESQINVAKEDSNTSGNDSAGTAQKLKDTVEYVESTKTEPKQKVDQWGQLVYSKQKLDKYGTPMYAKIISEPAADHVDSNKDKKCDRCGADLTTNTTPRPSRRLQKRQPVQRQAPSSSLRTVPSASTDPVRLRATPTSTSTTSCGAALETTKPDDKKEETPGGGTEGGIGAKARLPEALSTTTPAASVVVRGLMILKAAPTEKIVYDTSSAPVYDTSSDPVYEDGASRREIHRLADHRRSNLLFR
ncbi:MAG: hypothetical protein V8Q27_04540 [Eubacteriales bacterium]